MFHFNVLRVAASVLVLWGLSWTAVSCASAPPKAPEPAAVTTPAAAAAVEPVSDADWKAGRDALAEAEAAGAVQYAAELFTAAQSAFSQAQEKSATDPDAARALIKTAVTKANAARDAARAAKAAEWKATLEAQDKQAVEAIAEATADGAETTAADLLGQAKEALSQAREAAPTLPETAKASYETAIDKAHQARAAAKNAALSAADRDAAAARDAEAALAAERAAREAARLAAELQALLDSLDKEAKQAISEAEAAGAERYAPELLGSAREALIQAETAATSSPEEAKAAYRTAIDKAHEARDAANKAALAELDQTAQLAIADAEAAEAERYSPTLLNQARTTLSQGRAKAPTNPGEARRLMTLAAETALASREDSLKNRTLTLINELDTATKRFKALNPDRWDPDMAAPILAQAEAARAAVLADYATGLPLATEAVAAVDSATSKLSARLVAVQDLRLLAQKALDESEAVEAYIWVPDLVESANDAFFVGTGAWKKFRLDAAEEAWSTALFEARSATAKARAELERKRTEQLMLETMKKLEDASGKTIVDPQDNIVGPQAWDGKKELEKLKTKPVSVLIPADGSVVVMGDKHRVTYLDEAKDQWAEGVRALDRGDLTLANESFLQAQRLIDTYLAMAVDQIYTVRLIPDRRDSLWRISEYQGIYATPWAWPKIWKRNQKLIQNPDLIYPGWQLIIPAE